MGHLGRLPRPLSLMFPYSRRVMIVLRGSLYGVVSDRRVLGLSFHCHHEFDRIYTGSKHFIGSSFWLNFVFQCCVRRVSLTVPKQLIPVPPSIRPS